MKVYWNSILQQMNSPSSLLLSSSQIKLTTNGGDFPLKHHVWLPRKVKKKKKKRNGGKNRSEPKFKLSL